METVFISKCCKVEVLDDGLGGKEAIFCPKCEEPCEREEVCAECLGSGEVTTMERVYPNEPHMAPVGSEPCPACGGKGK